MAGIADMVGMGLITAALAPLVVLLTRDAAWWRRVRLPAGPVLAGFAALHAAVTIAMTHAVPMAVMALARPALLAGAVLFWLPVAGPAHLRLPGGRRCLYLFIAAPLLDLAALWLVAHGDYGGLAMITAMLPVSVAALAVTWQWAEAEERAARLAEDPPPGAANGTAASGRVPRTGHAAARRRRDTVPLTSGAGGGVLVTRRGIRLALGCLWLSAAALQAQPFMFTPGFGREVLGGAATGQPPPLAALIRTASGVVAAHPVATNSAFVAIQALIGVTLLIDRVARPALIGSIGWAFAVWAIGEGFGGVLAGMGGVVAGGPGAALLYGLLACCAMPPRDQSGSGLPPPAWVPAAWSAVWLALLLTGPWPRHPAGAALGSQLAVPAPGLPAAISRLLAGVPTLASRYQLAAVAVLALWQAFVAVAALRPGISRSAAVASGAVLALLTWACGQALGGIASGQATDVGTGPPLVLLAFAVLAARQQAAPAGATDAPVPALAQVAGGRPR